MNLSESVATLTSLLPVLKASDAKFASDLIASYKKYGGLTPKQEPWIGKLIARASAPAAPVAAAPVNVGGFAGVVALFNTAKAHLKFPKVRLVVNGTKVILSLNGPQSKAPGFVSISGEGQYPNRTYYGRVSPDGAFSPVKATYGDFLTALTGILTELASNPARVAKDHGKLTGNCCFCGKVLGLGKEQRSVLVGFGPDCAEHYGLKGEWLAGVAKAEAKASVAPLKLEGPWLGSANVETVAPAGYYTPTLAVPTAAQEAVDGLAADLAKATGSVSVTVTDGDLTGHSELGPDYIVAEPETKECFFCETPSTSTKTLHGFTVCAACVDQLK